MKRRADRSPPEGFSACDTDGKFEACLCWEMSATSASGQRASSRMLGPEANACEMLDCPRESAN